MKWRIESIMKNSIVFSIGMKPLFIEPPKPVKCFYYRCESKFCLDQIEKLYDEYLYWGLILASGKDTRYYKISVNNTIHLKTITEDLPNKKGAISESLCSNYSRKT